MYLIPKKPIQLTQSLLVMIFLIFMTMGLSNLKAESPLSKVQDLINAWQIYEAREALEQLRANQSQFGGVFDYVEANLLFQEGQYERAVSLYQKVKESEPSLYQRATDQIAEAMATKETLKGMLEEISTDGRFLIRYFKEDALLIPYLFEVLQKADSALSEDFQYQPKGQILVEIYPSAKYLADVTSLTEEEIETSGTIALCKYNRLMFTSPRALAKGYDFKNTVSHELVHYYVSKYSLNTVPIWLHEGIAKFQETRWQMAPGPHLDAPQEDLLAKSLAQNQLITFDQMHPSMAKLPSQEAAGLAFAEVHTVIAYLFKKKGYAGIRQLLQNLKNNMEMDQALMSSFGVDLNGLWQDWLADIKGIGLKEYPGLIQQNLKFKRPGQKDEDVEEDYISIKEKEVKDWTHLGELLRARNQWIAALAEYRKAKQKNGDGNPLIQNGIASTLIELKQYQAVVDELQLVKKYYPSYLNTHLNLGESLVVLKRYEDAIQSYEEALSLNPFHPKPHQALAKLYELLNQPQLAQRSKRSLELLGYQK